METSRRFGFCFGGSDCYPGIVSNDCLDAFCLLLALNETLDSIQGDK